MVVKPPSHSCDFSIYLFILVFVLPFYYFVCIFGLGGAHECTLDTFTYLGYVSVHWIEALDIIPQILSIPTRFN